VEQTGARPDIRAVEGDEDRRVSEDANTEGGGTPSERSPLPEEQELTEHLSIGAGALRWMTRESGAGRAGPIRGRPFRPRLPLVFLLEGHEQGEVFEPARVFRPERGNLVPELPLSPLLESLERPIQKTQLPGNHPAIVDPLGGKAGRLE